jgi:hypothetical protein
MTNQQDPMSLAAELRARALSAAAEDRADLLFLAAEYEALARTPDPAVVQDPVKVFLPK